LRIATDDPGARRDSSPTMRELIGTILHPRRRMLLIHPWSDGDIVVQRASAGETIRAEPFEAIKIRVSELLGDDDDDAPS
jgi:hypothetical protein